ncbi:MAG: hypothetical protein AB1450_12830 [Pseudomonadota bacterium]
MSQPSEIGATVRYYATPLRRLVWIVLSLLLLRATWFYASNDLHLATLIALLWLAFALSWVINLFRVPFATVMPDAVILLERLRFGRPNFMVVQAGALTALRVRPRGRIDIGLGAMGERAINLKYLSKTDRAAVIAALRGLAAPGA